MFFLLCLEVTQACTSSSASHQLLTGLLTLFNMPFVMFRRQKSCILPSAQHQQRTGLFVLQEMLPFRFISYKTFCSVSNKLQISGMSCHKMVCIILTIVGLLTELLVQLEYPYIMFRKNKILCITLTNTTVADRDICTFEVLFISHLEGSKYCALA